jgi:hypothetical protein
MSERKKAKKIPRSTKAVVIERVDQVKRWLLLEYSHDKLLRLGSARWRDCDRTIEKYITTATKQINETVLESHEEFRRKMKNHYNELLEQARKDDDFPEYRRVLLDMNRVLGYDQVKVINEGETTVKIKLPEGFEAKTQDDEK